MKDELCKHAKWRHVEVECPDCKVKRPMRIDQWKRNVESGRPFYCLPCSGQHRVYTKKSRQVFDFKKLDWSNNGVNPRNPLYSRWQKMRRRCKPGEKYHSKWYADTGIFVVDEWSEYEPFRVWSLKHGFKPELELDRIDPYGPYSPKNCRWITHAENCRNRRPRGFSDKFAKEAA